MNFNLIFLLTFCKFNFGYGLQKKQLTIDIMNHFEIHHGFFVKSKENESLENVKKFFSEGFSVTVLNPDQLTEYINKISFIYVKTIVVFEDKKLLELGKVFANVSIIFFLALLSLN